MLRLTSRFLLVTAMLAAGLGIAVAPSPALADSGCDAAAAPPIEGGVYQVSTQAHLMWIKEGNTLANVARLGFDYVLTQDIDMAGCTWTSGIADAAGDGNCTGGAGCFSGTFDGQGHTVRNYTMTVTVTGTDGAWVGFFGNVVDGTVRNLTVSGNTTVNSSSTLLSSYVGGVVGYARGTAVVTGLTSAGSVTLTSVDEAIYVGGVVGYCANWQGSLADLSNSAAVTGTNSGSTFGYVGGICAYQYGTLDGANNSGDVTASATTAYAGGISGYVSSTAGWVGPAGPIADSTSSGDISVTGGSTVYVGGVTGQYAYPTLSATSTGAISVANATSVYAGGLVGQTGTTEVSDSHATGSVTLTGVTGGVYAGGLLGFQNGKITRSYSTGAVSVTHSGPTSGFVSGVYAGGLVGYSSSNTEGIERSYATGNVTVTSPANNDLYAGGLTGFQADSLSQVFATGDVSATSTAGSASLTVYAGGISGSGNTTITDTYSLSSVTAASNAGDVYAGGIIGQTLSTLTDTYAAGEVTATSTSGTVSAAGSTASTGTLVRSFCVSTVAATCGLSSTPADQGTIVTTDELKTFALFDDAGWSITDGYSPSTTWGICSRYNDGFAFLVAIQTANPCADPDPAQVPPSWFQATARASADAPCPDGWNPSWAQWPNGGTGGFVCMREIYYDLHTGGWLSRSGRLAD